MPGLGIRSLFAIFSQKRAIRSENRWSNSQPCPPPRVPSVAPVYKNNKFIFYITVYSCFFVIHGCSYSYMTRNSNEFSRLLVLYQTRQIHFQKFQHFCTKTVFLTKQINQLEIRVLFHIHTVVYITVLVFGTLNLIVLFVETKFWISMLISWYSRISSPC